MKNTLTILLLFFSTFSFAQSGTYGLSFDSSGTLAVDSNLVEYMPYTGQKTFTLPTPIFTGTTSPYITGSQVPKSDTMPMILVMIETNTGMTSTMGFFHKADEAQNDRRVIFWDYGYVVYPELLGYNNTYQLDPVPAYLDKYKHPLSKTIIVISTQEIPTKDTVQIQGVLNIPRSSQEDSIRHNTIFDRALSVLSFQRLKRIDDDIISYTPYASGPGYMMPAPYSGPPAELTPAPYSGPPVDLKDIITHAVIRPNDWLATQIFSTKDTLPDLIIPQVNGGIELPDPKGLTACWRFDTTFLTIAQFKQRDAIQVLIEVCDTSSIDVYADPPTNNEAYRKQKFYAFPEVFWIYGYVVDGYKTMNDIRKRHLFYLDNDKMPLSSELFIWQTKNADGSSR